MLSSRSKHSLVQFLRLQPIESINTLLLKNEFTVSPSGLSSYEIETIMLQATDYQIRELLDEVLKTKNTLRYDVSPKYRFDERFNDLKKCLLLDGLQIEGPQLIQVEPYLDGTVQPEDALCKELER